MKRLSALVLGLMILFSAATACGSSSKSAHVAAPVRQVAPISQVAPAGQLAPVGQAAPGDQIAQPSPGTCAAAGTRRIPKTRLLADLALTYGAFHRYLYNPYKAGAFRSGAPGRTKALVKAGLASAAIVKLLSNARKNAAADPTLCKFVPNIDSIKDSLGGLTNKVRGGTATPGDLDSTSGMFEQLKKGTGFTPSGNASLPGLG
jgi:hypothetical protein